MMDADVDFDFSQFEKTLVTLGEILKEEMIAELLSQGHTATNELIQSIEMKVTKELDYISLDGSFIFYGRNVDQGRRAGARRVPLDALIEWVKQKGFSDDAKKVKGIAFAIQKTIFEKGISTPESWRGETTKNWMSNVLERNDQTIADLIAEGVEDMLQIAITNIITAAQSIYITR